MTPFDLKIVTPDGLEYQGKAEEVIVRSTSGDIGILAGHVNCVAPLGMGRATFVIDGHKRYAACIGGMLSVVDGKVTLVPTTFEWEDEIDMDRAAKAEERARAVLSDKYAVKTDLVAAEAKLKRSLVRQSVASSLKNR